MERQTPRWAHTALHELARQAQGRPHWTQPRVWDEIVSLAEDHAEARGGKWVYEGDVRHAFGAYHALLITGAKDEAQCDGEEAAREH